MTFLNGLTLLFVGLKMTGYLNWDWWWVLSPLLLPLVLIVMIYLIALFKGKN